MHAKLLISLALLFLLADVCRAQRRRNRNRNKGKGSNCHLKDVDKCLEPLSALGKQDNPTAIIATSDGVDRLCGTIKGKFGACVREYFKKCGTPLHREVSGLVLDQVLHHTKDMCSKGPKREKFLRASPCLHEKVLSTREAKDECNNRYLATLNAAGDRNDSLTSVCCGYRHWEDCTRRLARQKCGEDGVHALAFIVSHAFMDFPTLTCPEGLFDAESADCRAVVAPKGKKVRLNVGESGIGRYNVANMFSFMFSV